MKKLIAAIAVSIALAGCSALAPYVKTAHKTYCDGVPDGAKVVIRDVLTGGEQVVYCPKPHDPG